MYRSCIVDGEYGAHKITAKLHKDAENIQEFNSLEELHASPDYIAYQEDKANKKSATYYANWDKVVKSKQEELGMDMDKKALIQDAVLLHTVKGEPLPPKCQKAFDWLRDLWKRKYNDIEEGDTVSFDDIDPLGISYKEIQTELGS